MPVAVGMPLMVTSSAAHMPDTPGGKSAIVAPVHAVVEYVIAVIGVLMHLT